MFKGKWAAILWLDWAVSGQGLEAYCSLEALELYFILRQN
jgi:hypothetical protein